MSAPLVLLALCAVLVKHANNALEAFLGTGSRVELHQSSTKPALTLTQVCNDTYCCTAIHANPLGANGHMSGGRRGVYEDVTCTGIHVLTELDMWPCTAGTGLFCIAGAATCSCGSS